jgi:tetratricopeptide (TPR) repeat protein
MSLQDGSKLLAVIALCLIGVAPARAQSAQQLSDEGMALLNAGRYEEAAGRFEASQAARPVPMNLAWLGVAYTGMARPEKAVESYQAYVAAADPRAESETVRIAEGQIERITNQTARFALALEPSSAVVRIDGERVAPHKGELWVRAGRHRIAIMAEGYESYQQTLDVQAGRYNLEIKLRVPSGPPQSRAEALIASGEALAAQSDHEGALAMYEEAQTIYPSAHGYARIGLSQEPLGRFAAAEAAILEALKQRRDPWLRLHRAELNKAKARLQKQLGTIDVSGSPAGAQVFVNGRPVGPLPLKKVRAEAGTVTVKGVMSGYLDSVQEVQLKARRKAKVYIVMAQGTMPVAPVVAAGATSGAAATEAAVAKAALEQAASNQAAAVAAAALMAAERAAAAEAARLAAEQAAAEEAARRAAAQAEADKLRAEDARRADIEAQAYAEAARKTPAQGFELKILGGAQFYLGDEKPPAPPEVASVPEISSAVMFDILLGARFPWFLSYGAILSGGFNLSHDDMNFAAANPGFYVRGHVQKERRAMWYDAWAGLALRPVSMSAGLVKAQPIDPATVDATQLNSDVSMADLAANAVGLDYGVIHQSVELDVQFGGTWWITSGVGLELALNVGFHFPTQTCLKKSDDTLCFDENLEQYLTFGVQGGLALLP